MTKEQYKNKAKKDYNQPQALACSLGGYSHREHYRAPDDKNYTSKQVTTHQLSYAVEKADFIFNSKIKAAQVRGPGTAGLTSGKEAIVPDILGGAAAGITPALETAGVADGTG